MRPILFIIAFFSLVGALAGAVTAKTVFHEVAVGISWLSFVVALAAVFILNGIEDVANHARDTNEYLHRLAVRKTGKERVPGTDGAG